MATRVSDEIARIFVKSLRAIKIDAEINNRKNMKMVARATLMVPLARGREAVRATLESICRSKISFQVQPAERIRVAPIRKISARIVASQNRKIFIEL